MTEIVRVHSSKLEGVDVTTDAPQRTNVISFVVFWLE